MRLAQLRACLAGAAGERVASVTSVQPRTLGLNGGAPIYTTGSLEAPEVYSYEVSVPAGAEGPWQLEIASGLDPYRGSAAGVLARVGGTVSPPYS